MQVCEQIKVDLEAGDARLQTAASQSVSDPQKLEQVYLNSRKVNQSTVEEARVNEMTYTQLNLLRALSTESKHASRVTVDPAMFASEK